MSVPFPRSSCTKADRNISLVLREGAAEREREVIDSDVERKHLPGLAGGGCGEREREREVIDSDVERGHR